VSTPDPSGPTFDELRVILDSMAVPVARASRSFRYVWANDPYAKWLRVTLDQIIGRSIADVLGQPAFEALRPHFKRVLRGERVEYEEKIHLSGIGERWIRATYTPTFGPDLVPDGWIAVVTDIDERRRVENALRERKELLLKLHEASSLLVRERMQAQKHAREHDHRLRVLANAAPVFLFRILPDLTTEYLTSSYFDYTGLKQSHAVEDAQALPSINFQSVFHPDELRLVLRRWKSAIENPQPLHYEFRLRRADGVYRWFAARAEPDYDLEGLLTGFNGAIFEIQEQKETEEALRDANRRKDDFLAMLSHELRNPLTPITLAVSSLSRRVEANNRELQIIRRQTGHLTRLIDDLLDVERLASGKIELRPAYVELSALIAITVEAVRPVMETKGHHLDVQIPESGLLVFGDPARLRQIFANLLNNAARYTPQGGHISVLAEPVGPDVLVEVRDDGEGIDPESLAHLFEMFFQTPRPLDRAKGGLGLGLTLVKSLVELHGGEVSAASAGRGQGSRFTVKLPLSSSTAPSELPQTPAIASKNRLKVLVVEDYADIAETISELLRQHGHEVEAVSDGRAALELLTTFSPDVAFIDIGLPVMDGYELARRIAQRMPERIPSMIAMSGYGQPRDLEKSCSAGFHLHLVKPIDAGDVLKALASLPLQGEEIL
jgi:two-component system, chemotaxis family, CheB/CheR fusion protein